MVALLRHSLIETTTTESMICTHIPSVPGNQTTGVELAAS